MINRVLFIGSKESGFRMLETLQKISKDTLVGCVTVNDTDDIRSELKKIKQFCFQRKIPIEVLSGRCDLTDSIKKYKPELCIVMGWYYLISKEIIEMVQNGFIGIHNSLLPAYRGFAPVVWSILSGDKETGFSIFSFDEGMDTGNIWYQEKVEIDHNDYVGDVLNKIDEAIYLFFEKHYAEILSENIKPVPQKAWGISYGARRTPEDGRIDWSQDAKEVYDFIRAQSHPYPGAYTEYKNEKIIVWRSEIFPYPIHGKPGQIGLIKNEYVVIVCGFNSGIIIRKVDIKGIECSVKEVVKGMCHRMI